MIRFESSFMDRVVVFFYERVTNDRNAWTSPMETTNEG